MSHLTTGQQLYLARCLAKRHGLFVVVKTRTDPKSSHTDYFLYREHEHARPSLVGKRESAAALLALTEINTGAKATWPTPSPSQRHTPTHQEAAHANHP